MAIYDNLPVYKTSYDLLLQLFTLSKNMERDYRFTIGEELKKEIVQLMINIYRANCSQSKKELITNAKENIEITRLLLRILHDLKQIGLKEFVSANEKIESISKQLNAWLNSQAKKKKFDGESPEGQLVFPESAG